MDNIWLLCNSLFPLWKCISENFLLMNMFHNLFKYSSSYENLDSSQFSFPLLYTIILLCLTSLVIRWKSCVGSTFVASYHISLATSTAIVDSSLWALTDSISVLPQAGHFHSLSCFTLFSFNSNSLHNPHTSSSLNFRGFNAPPKQSLTNRRQRDK